MMQQMQDKVKPDSASYVETDPAANYTCDGCKHFITPSSCGVVQGSIDPKGSCFLWEPGKDSPTAPEAAKVSATIAGYEGSNGQGGFGCKRCENFTNPGCTQVDVNATTKGCCNLWVSGANKQAADLGNQLARSMPNASSSGF